MDNTDIYLKKVDEIVDKFQRKVETTVQSIQYKVKVTKQVKEMIELLKFHATETSANRGSGQFKTDIVNISCTLNGEIETITLLNTGTTGPCRPDPCNIMFNVKEGRVLDIPRIGLAGVLGDMRTSKQVILSKKETEERKKQDLLDQLFSKAVLVEKLRATIEKHDNEDALKKDANVDEVSVTFEKTTYTLKKADGIVTISPSNTEMTLESLLNQYCKDYMTRAIVRIQMKEQLSGYVDQYEKIDEIYNSLANSAEFIFGKTNLRFVQKDHSLTVAGPDDYVLTLPKSTEPINIYPYKVTSKDKDAIMENDFLEVFTEMATVVKSKPETKAISDFYAANMKLFEQQRIEIDDSKVVKKYEKAKLTEFDKRTFRTESEHLRAVMTDRCERFFEVFLVFAERLFLYWGSLENGDVHRIQILDVTIRKGDGKYEFWHTNGLQFSAKRVFDRGEYTYMASDLVAKEFSQVQNLQKDFASIKAKVLDYENALRNLFADRYKQYFNDGTMTKKANLGDVSWKMEFKLNTSLKFVFKNGDSTTTFIAGDGKFYSKCTLGVCDEPWIEMNKFDQAYQEKRNFYRDYIRVKGILYDQNFNNMRVLLNQLEQDNFPLLQDVIKTNLGEFAVTKKKVDDISDMISRLFLIWETIAPFKDSQGVETTKDAIVIDMRLYEIIFSQQWVAKLGKQVTMMTMTVKKGVWADSAFRMPFQVVFTNGMAGTTYESQVVLWGIISGYIEYVMERMVWAPPKFKRIEKEETVVPGMRATQEEMLEKWNDMKKRLFSGEKAPYNQQYLKQIEKREQKKRENDALKKQQLEQKSTVLRIESEKVLEMEEEEEEEEGEFLEDERIEREAKEKERIEIARIAKEKLENTRKLENEKLENERVEREKKLENERVEREKKLENERVEREKKLENERVEREKKLENEKLENERVEREKKLENEKLENERVEREKKLENERVEREKKLENERVEREKKLENEKLENEKLEKEKLENEKLEKEKLEIERKERERLEREKKLENEKLENEKLENEKLENEKLENEKLEKRNLKKRNLKMRELKERNLKKRELKKRNLKKRELKERNLKKRRNVWRK